MRIFLSVILLTVLFVSCKKDKKGGQQNAPSEYAVTAVNPETVTIHQDFPATIQGQQVIEIRPIINGYIQQIFVNEGDHVKKGQLLFKIRNPMYEQQVITAKASINKAEADLNTSSMEVDKVKPLVEKDIVSNYRLKSAELKVESSKAALEQAKAELANAETNLAYTSIRSPEDGIIGTIPFKTGALVSSNMQEALTTLSDISNVYAYFSWNEKQLLDFLSHSHGTTIDEKIKNIPPARLILANSSEYPEKGRVEMASGLISTETGSATFKAVFPNKNGLIRSGSSAVVRIPEVKDSVYIIPQSATYELQDKRFVYTVGNDNKVTATPFDAVPSDDGKHFLVTAGLSPGDRIVIAGINSLRDGAEIIPRDTVQVFSRL
ncbi:MAG TPA: efflux RND transporter periplasmic adaptor subunit [Bacteroidales bacterium]|nr:efflux RND transporter periplasmic adaptor subunit [Bacteroidales bacterium]